MLLVVTVLCVGSFYGTYQWGKNEYEGYMSVTVACTIVCSRFECCNHVELDTLHSNTKVNCLGI